MWGESHLEGEDEKRVSKENYKSESELDLDLAFVITDYWHLLCGG